MPIKAALLEKERDPMDIMLVVENQHLDYHCLLVQS
jgi:hypothetical protein